jgi:tyrosine-protein kinase Etk/Wzc
MNQIQNNSFLDQGQEKDFKIKEQLSIYLHQWRWFLIAIIISVTFGFLYLKYTLPKYFFKAAILIKD